jgi:H+/Cl- antiporter ClcA
MIWSTKQLSAVSRTRITLVVIGAGVVLGRQKPIVHFARDLDAK